MLTKRDVGKGREIYATEAVSALRKGVARARVGEGGGENRTDMANSPDQDKN